MIKRFIKFVFDVINGLLKDNITAYSAQSAFFMTISFIPLSMLLISLLKFLPIPEQEILSGAISFFPGDTKELVSSLINESFEKSGAAVISITAVSTLWAASMGVFSVVGGLNNVFSARETRNFIVVRIMSMFYTLVFLVVLVLCLLLFVFGNTVTDAMEKNLSHGFGVAALIMSGRAIIAVIILSLLFITVYSVVPNRKVKLITQVPGSLISSCGWIGFSTLFSYYYENVSNYSYLYGSLSAMVFFMLWLFVCIYILFIGAEVNKCIENRLERISLLKN